MSQDNNVKSIRSYVKEAHPTASVSTLECSEVATALGLKIDLKLSSKSRKEIANILIDRLNKKASSLSIPSQQTLAPVDSKMDIISTSPQSEVSLSTSTANDPAGSLAPMEATEIQMKEAAKQIYRLGDADKSAATDKVMSSYALDMISASEALKELLALVSYGEAAFNQALIEGINQIQTNSAMQLQDFANQLEDRRKANKASMENSLQLMRNALERVKNM